MPGNNKLVRHTPTQGSRVDLHNSGLEEPQESKSVTETKSYMRSDNTETHEALTFDKQEKTLSDVMIYPVNIINEMIKDREQINKQQEIIQELMPSVAIQKAKEAGNKFEHKEFDSKLVKVLKSLANSIWLFGNKSKAVLMCCLYLLPSCIKLHFFLAKNAIFATKQKKQMEKQLLSFTLAFFNQKLINKESSSDIKALFDDISLDSCLTNICKHISQEIDVTELKSSENEDVMQKIFSKILDSIQKTRTTELKHLKITDYLDVLKSFKETLEHTLNSNQDKEDNTEISSYHKSFNSALAKHIEKIEADSSELQEIKTQMDEHRNPKPNFPEGKTWGHFSLTTESSKLEKDNDIIKEANKLVFGTEEYDDIDIKPAEEIYRNSKIKELATKKTYEQSIQRNIDMKMYNPSIINTEINELLQASDEIPQNITWDSILTNLDKEIERYTRSGFKAPDERLSFLINQLLLVTNMHLC